MQLKPAYTLLITRLAVCSKHLASLQNYLFIYNHEYFNYYL